MFRSLNLIHFYLLFCYFILAFGFCLNFYWYWNFFLLFVTFRINCFIFWFWFGLKIWTRFFISIPLFYWFVFWFLVRFSWLHVYSFIVFIYISVISICVYTVFYNFIFSSRIRQYIFLFWWFTFRFTMNFLLRFFFICIFLYLNSLGRIFMNCLFVSLSIFCTYPLNLGWFDSRCLFIWRLYDLLWAYKSIWN